MVPWIEGWLNVLSSLSMLDSFEECQCRFYDICAMKQGFIWLAVAQKKGT